ncbi:MAG TPA: tRNA (adenosine(37)-N6)-threonylcarbamoyltransferase complex dimerization subunit type 1 TsaB [Thermoflexia bacterium]|jgi:tRNA threonylcarbamoyladenosine biosynthesis protein TsaB|nr:tRNA (adenosine(37)-N6)-threonylcarbamoyltransferase complex dimerization subunit type 1 TsaB [Thermoflexia bacterium]
MLLAIDTATRTASLALHDGSRIRYEATWEAGRRHTVQLAPRLSAALEDLGAGTEDLTGVAVATGPGSFTGLRVGMAMAKGLAMACNLPLVGVPTLDIVAAAQGRDRRPLLAVLQAGRGRICVATYRWRNGWQRRDGPRLTTWDALVGTVTRSTLFCGEVDERGMEALERLGDLATVLPPAHCLRRAGFLAELAWDRIRRGETDDPATLAPIYLHGP